MTRPDGLHRGWRYGFAIVGIAAAASVVVAGIAFRWSNDQWAIPGFVFTALGAVIALAPKASAKRSERHADRRSNQIDSQGGMVGWTDDLHAVRKELVAAYPSPLEAHDIAKQSGGPVMSQVEHRRTADAQWAAILDRCLSQRPQAMRRLLTFALGDLERKESKNVDAARVAITTYLAGIPE